MCIPHISRQLTSMISEAHCMLRFSGHSCPRRPCDCCTDVRPVAYGSPSRGTRHSPSHPSWSSRDHCPYVPYCKVSPPAQRIIRALWAKSQVQLRGKRKWTRQMQMEMLVSGSSWTISYLHRSWKWLGNKVIRQCSLASGSVSTGLNTTSSQPGE